LGAKKTITKIMQTKNLESYYGPIMALRGISINIVQGDIVTVLGANGAGKTTLLKNISGVMRPEKGNIFLEDAKIEGCEPDALVKMGISHVPEGREIFPLLSVEKNLMMGAFTRGNISEIKNDFELVLSYFPVLRDRLEQQANTLSGGEQQMLAIGRGLMSKPRIMLLDEPSLGLSPKLVKDIFFIIKKLNEEQKLTFLLVEQNAKAALGIAKHGYVMELGRIVLEGKTSELVASKDIQEFYLGAKEESQLSQKRWKNRKTWR
tara:strand:- start:317 stop:1105 length:789 start_codon:yes stop_codon:yes gene_type:complete